MCMCVTLRACCCCCSQPAAVVQLLETSGVADVEPLAALLTSSGFKLAGVVTVVDAEAGSSQLEHEGVALAQVCVSVA